MRVPRRVHTDPSCADLGGPRAAVALTNTGSFAVVADPALDARTTDQVVAYAEALAALSDLPAPRRPLDGER